MCPTAKKGGLQAGFTLIEMLVTLGVSGMLLAGISGVFMAQVQQHQLHLRRRGVQSGGRQATSFVEGALRRVGYGVDPDRALLAYDGFNVNATAAPDLRFPDAITLHARDPVFNRTATAANASSITISSPLTEAMALGQILLVLCSGAQNYSYVTVASSVSAGSTVIPLATSATHAESPISRPGARFHQQANLTQSCYASATVVKVNRASFYLAAFDEDANSASPSIPYLMFHRGTDVSGDGRVDVNDAVPLTSGVEQLQISYALNTAAGAAPNLLGVTSAAVPGWGDDWASSITTPAQWYWTDSYSAARRLISHPANVRQVRVSMVLRGNTAEQGARGDEVYDPNQSWSSETLATSGVVAWRQLEDLDSAPAPDFDPTSPTGATAGFVRRMTRFSVSPKNLLMRSQFLPPNLLSGTSYGG
jgi:type IV pilus assembly protein PilW